MSPLSAIFVNNRQRYTHSAHISNPICFLSMWTPHPPASRVPRLEGPAGGFPDLFRGASGPALCPRGRRECLTSGTIDR